MMALIGEGLTLLQQIEPPTNLVALQWIIITTLAGAVVYLFRLLAARYDKTLELVAQQHEAARETNEALRDVADAIRSLERSIDLDSSLREALRRNGKDRHGKD